MSDESEFRGAYDAASDVLYLQHPGGIETRGIQDEYGFVWRYGADGNLLGVTIMDFRDLWFEDRNLVTDRISEKFHVSSAVAGDAVARIAGLK